VAAGGDAAAVAEGGGAALGAVPGAGAAAEVEDLGGAVQDGGHDEGVAGELAQGGRGQGATGVGSPGPGQRGPQLGEGGGDGEHGQRAHRPEVRGPGGIVGSEQCPGVLVRGAGGVVAGVVAGVVLRVAGGAGRGGEEVDQRAAAAFGQAAGVLEPVVAGGGGVGAAQPGVQHGFADGAEVEKGAQPAAVAAQQQLVAFGGLGGVLGALGVAVQGGRVGGVVGRGAGGEGFEDGLPGAGEVPRGQRRALVEQEACRGLPVGRGHLGQQHHPVEGGGEDGGLLDGDRRLGQRRAHLGVTAQQDGLAVPGGDVGGGEPEPVTQPPLQAGGGGAGLEVPCLGGLEQGRPQRGGPGLQLEQPGERGLHLAVAQPPHVGDGGRVEGGARDADPGRDRVLDEGACLTHAPNLGTTPDTTPRPRTTRKPCVDNRSRRRQPVHR
jgi:DNA polymerase-3 subunit gamma/tau